MMTKKEKREHEEMVEKIRILSALRFTDKVKPDIDIPLSGETHGYTFNAYNQTVSKSWSSPVSHGNGDILPSDRYSASKSGIRMYSSELLSLRAMRNECEVIFARQLADIDKKICEHEQQQKGES